MKVKHPLYSHDVRDVPEAMLERWLRAGWLSVEAVKVQAPMPADEPAEELDALVEVPAQKRRRKASAPPITPVDTESATN